MANRYLIALEGPGAHRDRRALGVRGRLGDDVDDPVHGIGAPHGSAGAANDFDTVDVLQQQVFAVPEDARECMGVDRPAIDEHEQLVREQIVEPAGRDGPLVRVDLRDLHAGHEPEQLGQRTEPRSPDVILRDDEHRGRDILGALLLLRGGCDLDLHQIFDRDAREIRGPVWAWADAGDAEARAQCDQRREQRAFGKSDFIVL